MFYTSFKVFYWHTVGTFSSSRMAWVFSTVAGWRAVHSIHLIRTWTVAPAWATHLWVNSILLISLLQAVTHIEILFSKLTSHPENQVGKDNFLSHDHSDRGCNVYTGKDSCPQKYRWRTAAHTWKGSENNSKEISVNFFSLTRKRLFCCTFLFKYPGNNINVLKRQYYTIMFKSSLSVAMQIVLAFLQPGGVLVSVQQWHWHSSQ